MNTILLKSEMLLKGITFNDLAKSLKISKSALYRKMKNKSELSRKEISAIINLLGITKEKALEIFFSDIFFDEKVS